MLFLNPWLLAGLGGVAIPILIHLARKQAAKPIDWGAMRFLFDTVAVRKRKMEWEDLLLMAARCLLLALVALAVSRPFMTPDSQVPWMFVLPAALVGVALMGGSFVISNGRWRWLLRGGAALLLIAATGLVMLEKQLNLKRFEASGRRDVALVIDASDSMQVRSGSGTVFEAAVAEAMEVVKKSPRGTAFSVVLGGPAPQAVTAEPLTHRADVLGVLDELKPVGGTFRAHEALGVATLGLMEGANASKEIVVFSDSQRHGWRFENPAAWDGLEEAWKSMAAKPKLLLRSFGRPQSFRNLALGGFELSRAVVGTDREVSLRVVIENTGDEPVTPGAVTMEIDGRVVGEQPVGLLAAGQRETLEFRHRFTKPGPVVIRTRIEVDDDLAEDNRLERVIAVRKSLSVLLVEGNASGDFFERGVGYLSLALAPGRKADDYLMAPKLVAAGELRAGDFKDCDVVVLGDVPRLPESLATELANKVASGCGLLVIAGPRAEPSFYGEWSGPGGKLVPLAMAEEKAEVEGVGLAASTYIHEALALFKEGSDLDDALIKRWRSLGEPVEGAVVGASFANGDAFLATRNYGEGRSMLLTCALDARSGNLPAKRGFVPLVHELVTWLAGGGLELNVASAWSPSVVLGGSSGGLSAKYYRKNKVVLERTDPTIDFRWMNDAPSDEVGHDNFRVEWSGLIVAPKTGSYTFHASADDNFELTIGDGKRMKCGLGDHELGSVQLKAGEPQKIEVKFREGGGEAYAQLFWTPPGGQRTLVPAEAFQVSGGGGAAMKVVDPWGLPRTAEVRKGRRGEELAIDGAAMPGIYEVEVGDSGAAWLDGWEGGKLPVAVVRADQESHFEAMDEQDLELLRSKVDLVLPGSAADILNVLQGKGFGREIWKLLAVAAFVLFLLESVLARWVSKSRRAAEDVRVDFGEQATWEGGRS